MAVSNTCTKIWQTSIRAIEAHDSLKYIPRYFYAYSFEAFVLFHHRRLIASGLLDGMGFSVVRYPCCMLLFPPPG